MQMYVGITDYDWFEFLKSKNAKEVNFWKENDSSSEDYSYTNRKSKFDLAEYYGWDPSMEISKEDFLDQL